MTIWTPITLASAGENFCNNTAHQDDPYCKRNWGGQLHSLCSYQGKLKPSIAHFLVKEFTSPGDRVLDPMSGIGTIPLEARRQGRIAFAGDLSPLAHTVSRAKLEPFDEKLVWEQFRKLQCAIEKDHLDKAIEHYQSFGLNRPLSEYFHPKTLRELFIAREHLVTNLTSVDNTTEQAIISTAILHILHGNRPYALSRRSHPITPFAPQGETVYKSVIEYTKRRLNRIIPSLAELNSTESPGRSLLQGFESSYNSFVSVDSVITSPPFSDSLRFWSSNWMRLWFAGWEPENFKSGTNQFLETRQRKDINVYSEFSRAMARVIKPGGSLILHLGQTKKIDMVTEIAPLLTEEFDVSFVGRESVLNAEKHGLTDKGSTVAHTYLFASRR